jgi:hypothetical protein
VEKVAQVEEPSEKQTAAIENLKYLVGLAPPPGAPFHTL